MSAWRPIATAPTGSDIDPIDVWQVFTHNGALTAQRRVPDAIWSDGGWADEDGEPLQWKDELGQAARVTHWQPIPEPPTEPECATPDRAA